jgi:hypothetical protein
VVSGAFVSMESPLGNVLDVLQQLDITKVGLATAETN